MNISNKIYFSGRKKLLYMRADLCYLNEEKCLSHLIYYMNQNIEHRENKGRPYLINHMNQKCNNKI